MLGKDGIFEKYVTPFLLAVIFFTGFDFMWNGEYALGVINVLTGLYLVFQFLTQRTGYMPKWAFIFMVVLTVLMVVSCVYLIHVGKYFGLFASIIVIIGGLMTMYAYYGEDQE
ncbi:hypothetical protein KIOSHI_178 [Bacillus phage Kioshi]|nr:hypothetical protein KIOSHI_178 [Bacillus phage Kioshi]